MMNKQEHTSKNTLIYLIAGGAIGAGLAMLFAPKSGRETREDISNATLKGFEQAKEFSTNVSEKAKNVYTQAQAKALETYSTAKDGINSTIESAKENFSVAVDEVKSLPEKAENFAAQGLENVALTADQQAKKMKA